MIPSYWYCRSSPVRINSCFHPWQTTNHFCFLLQYFFTICNFFIARINQQSTPFLSVISNVLNLSSDQHLLLRCQFGFNVFRSRILKIKLSKSQEFPIVRLVDALLQRSLSLLQSRRWRSARHWCGTERERIAGTSTDTTWPSTTSRTGYSWLTATTSWCWTRSSQTPSCHRHCPPGPTSPLATR